MQSDFLFVHYNLYDNGGGGGGEGEAEAEGIYF